ncbi:putative cytochrome P450 [Chaetomium fimeti]|jgi:cytochrome P450|uniref:Cytochrome P450 n=1 Tax=Chaetomium fimeti TaxID=1854472 RepID=A0AAE0LUM4_9PEZI|nr:putative cytochrome P450 [Chaetomium fimeti]
MTSKLENAFSSMVVELPSTGIPSQYTSVALGALVLSAITWFIKASWSEDSYHFRNGAGQHIKVFPKDTRTLRYSNGKEVSEQGKQLAKDEPYLMPNRRYRDLVLVTPEQLKEFMAGDGKDHTKPRGGGMGDYAWRLLGQCVGQQSGTEKWKTMRSHFDPEFSHQATLRVEPVFKESIDNWLGHLSASTSSASFFVQDAVTTCRSLALRLLAVMSYGEVMDEETFAKLDDMTSLHRQIMGALVFNTKLMSKAYNLLPTVQRRQLQTFNRGWKQFNLEAVQRARKLCLDCPVERIYAGVEQGDMTLVEYLQSLDEMLYTNIDITGLVLACLLTNIASHPEFQARLRSEILEEKQKPGYTPSAYSAKQETLLNYVTLESIRLNPALHFSPVACTAEDKTIGGYRIPALTTCTTDVWRINTDRGAWGADAETFRPERFAGVNPSSYRYSFIKWGVGSSKCMGKNMADLLLKMTVVAVLERFELRPAETEVESDRDTITNKLRSGIEFRRV